MFAPMLRTCTVRVACVVRTLATAKDRPFLSDAVAKAAIGKDLEVAASFVSAFAAVVHQRRVRVTDVSHVSGTTGLSISREMKHDIALRYSIGGMESAVLEVVPQNYNRALVEIQLSPENYLPGRALAHASGHYLAAINEEAKKVKEEKQKKEELRASHEKGNLAAQPHRPRSNSPRTTYDNAIYSAYVRVEPVHLLMLSEFCYAHDTKDNVWRSPKTSSVLSGGKYGFVSPLFSTFRLTTDAGSMQLVAGLNNPGSSTFASSLRDRLSITMVHLPLVPLSLSDKDAWSKVVTLPEHHKALESNELRQWLHYLAHSSLKDGKVEMPADLRPFPIFRKSAEMAETTLQAGPLGYSEKEMADNTFLLNRERDSAREEAKEAQVKERAAKEELVKERAAAKEALVKERAVAKEELVKERAAANVELVKERAAANVELVKERAAAAKREAMLQMELELLKKPGSGTF